MNTANAKRLAHDWIESNLSRWPGLRAAHLVGGVTSLPDDAPFPPQKDLDLHLIFDDGSPALRSYGPFANVLEECFAGLSIEAGVKSAADYSSAEAVLGNPEIAHHLTVDSVLYDPSGLLRDLQVTVRREYPRRRWVLARLAHERRGLDGALAMRAMVAAQLGASGELNILGYSATYLTATLAVATLNPPRMGSRMLLHLRDRLQPYDRLDLYDELLAVLGLRDVCPDRVEQFLHEGIAAFDIAVEVRKTPHPAQHKLHRHLRSYFVTACRAMLDEGNHREALFWLILFYLSATDIVLIDGPETEQPRFAAYQAGFLRELGMEETMARDAAFMQAGRLYDRYFELAEEIVAAHPAVTD